MNLEELQAARDRERQTDKLQQLRESFYADAGDFIQQLRAERERAAERADNPFDSPEVSQLSDEIETAQQTVEAIYEKRVGKIVKAASFAAADLPAEADGMTAEEQELFDTLVGNIQQNRQHVLDVIDGEASPATGSEEPASSPAEPDVAAADLMGAEADSPLPESSEQETETARAPESNPPKREPAGGSPESGTGAREAAGEPPTDHSATGHDPTDHGMTGHDRTGHDGAATEPSSPVETSDGATEGKQGGTQHQEVPPEQAGSEIPPAQEESTGQPEPNLESERSGTEPKRGGETSDHTGVESDRAGAEPTTPHQGEAVRNDGGTRSARGGNDGGAQSTRGGNDGGTQSPPGGSGGGVPTQDEQSGNEQPGIDRETVRITADVGTFIGTDERDYDLETDDVVQLPETNATVLVERDAAERLD